MMWPFEYLPFTINLGFSIAVVVCLLAKVLPMNSRLLRQRSLFAALAMAACACLFRGYDPFAVWANFVWLAWFNDAGYYSTLDEQIEAEKTLRELAL